MERPLVSMIARLIRSRLSAPHEIVQAEMAATPTGREALNRFLFLTQTMGPTQAQMCQIGIEYS
eukprot:c46681_g1_i1 orf=23-214(+)